MESVDGESHPITIISNPGTIWQNAIEKLFILRYNSIGLFFDEKVTINIELYDDATTNVQINGNTQTLTKGSSTFTDVSFLSMSRIVFLSPSLQHQMIKTHFTIIC